MLNFTTAITRRYRLQYLLGAGGMGEVYAAFDRLTGTSVALKRVLHTSEDLLFSTRLSRSKETDLRRALTDEFRFLASLRHPHIISVLDYGFDTEQHPYYTMTLLTEPRTILDAAQTLTFSQKIQAFAEILQALSYLHRRGILHRDIKPGNVLLGADETVKLVDFGLAVYGTASGTAGTLGYMAPEIILQENATPQTDLYAVGILGYEIFTGHHPFNLTDISDFLHQTLHVMPDIQPVPETVQSLLLRLLMKDPSDRYPDAEHALTDLSAVTEGAVVLENAGVRESFLQAARFIGRNTELARITTSLNTVIDSTRDDASPVGAAYLIGGESGAGKSRLLDELRTHALLNGALVLRGQAVGGSRAPFDIWRDVMRRLIIETEVSDLEASILHELVPDIAVLLERDIPTTPYVSANAAQNRLIDTMLAVLQRLAQPTLLILEDLHWAVESLIPLKHLLRVISHMPFLIVGSYRHDETPSLPEKLAGVQVIKLERMTIEEITELSTAMIGTAGSEKHLIEYLHRQSEGNVLFLVEIMRALADDTGDLRSIGSKTLPSQIFAGGIERIIQERLHRLPTDAAPALQLAAVAGRKIDVALLRHLLGSDAERWLQAGMDAAILDIEDDHWRFAHDRLRDAVLSTIPETLLPQYHRRIAEGLETLYPESAEVASQLHSHWQAAHVIEKEAYYATIVIEQRVLLGMIQDAVRLVDQTLALNPQDNRVRLKLYQLAGEIQADDGMAEVARDYYAKGLDLAKRLNDLKAMGIALEGLGSTTYTLSDFPTAQRYLDESLVLRRGIGDLMGVASSLHHLSVLQRFVGDYPASYTSIQESTAIRRQINDQHGLAYSLYQMGVHARLQGNFADGVTYLLEGQQLHLMLGDARGLVENLNNLGLCYMLLGQFEEAHSTLIESLTMRRSMDNKRGIASTLNALADVQIQRQLARGYAMGLGSTLNALADVQLLREYLPAALRYAGEALRIWHFYQDKWNIANSYASIAIVQLWLHERYSARYHLLEGLRLSRDIKVPFILLKALIGWARLHVMDGQPQQAAVLLGLVEHHSALSAQLKQTHFNVLAASLPLDNYPNEYALGRASDLYQVVQQILTDADLEDGL